MYCEKCGQEIEPSEICPKCGCLSGYVDVQKISNQQREKVKNLPVIIISCVGILLLIINAFLISIFTWLQGIVGILAFISLVTGKFEKIKFLYPIALILAEIFNVCYYIFNYDDFEIRFRIAPIMFMFSMIAEIIFMCRKTKSIGIISIIALSISIIANAISVESWLLLEYLFFYSLSPAFLLYVIANFLYINNKNKIENEKALL